MFIDKKIKVAELMTADVLYVQPDDTLEKVADIFESNNIHHLPVTDEEGRVVGMLSKGDFNLVKHGFSLFKNRDAVNYNIAIFRSLLVNEVMTKKVAKLDLDDTAEYAAGIFRENYFHAMPVVNKKGILMGILSAYDLLNYAFRHEALIA